MRNRRRGQVFRRAKQPINGVLLRLSLWAFDEPLTGQLSSHRTARASCTPGPQACRAQSERHAWCELGPRHHPAETSPPPMPPLRHGEPLPKRHLAHAPVHGRLIAVRPRASRSRDHQAEAKRCVHDNVLPRLQQLGCPRVKKHFGPCAQVRNPGHPIRHNFPSDRLKNLRLRCVFSELV